MSGSLGIDVQELVIERSKTHYPPIRVSMLLVILGTCVFFWGLGYKLSLYKTHGPTLHRIPAAKLLSKNEDTSATDTLQLCLASAAVSSQIGLIFSTALMVLLTISGPRLFLNGIVRTPDGPRPQLRFFLSALFFRPPPIHSVL